MEPANPPFDEITQPFQKIKQRHEAIQNRVAYEELGTVLASVDNEDFDAAILSYVALKVGDDTAREYEIITGLPSGCLAYYTTLMVDLEIPNGGYNQYFWNRDEFASEAVRGYRTIGALKHAALMEEAIVIYQAEIEMHKKFRDKDSLEAFSESYKHTALGELDERYYALEDDTDALRFRYVRQHPEAFVAR